MTTTKRCRAADRNASLSSGHSWLIDWLIYCLIHSLTDWLIDDDINHDDDDDDDDVSVRHETTSAKFRWWTGRWDRRADWRASRAREDMHTATPASAERTAPTGSKTARHMSWQIQKQGHHTTLVKSWRRHVKALSAVKSQSFVSWCHQVTTVVDNITIRCKVRSYVRCGCKSKTTSHITLVKSRQSGKQYVCVKVTSTSRPTGSKWRYDVVSLILPMCSAPLQASARRTPRSTCCNIQQPTLTPFFSRCLETL